MSATRDKSQKFTFVYSNLYQIYKKGKEAAHAAEIPSEEPKLPSSGKVLKAGVVHPAEVKAFEPPIFVGKKLEEKKAKPQEDVTLESLKTNLKSLNDLHQRLRFMLQELEELVKE